MNMKRLPLLTLVFAFLSVVFFLLLIFLRIPFPFYPLMSYQDVFDILTPIVLIPLYWVLFKNVSSEEASLVAEIFFMSLAAMWVAGQGMHLAANSINNLSEGLARNGVLDITNSTIYQLTYFIDEHLSHYLWHIGVAGLAALLIAREWRNPSGAKTIWWIAVLAGIIYGFTLFCIFLEGQTVPLGFPFVGAVTVILLIWGRKGLGQRPVTGFLFTACLLATLLFLGWLIYYGGFPQFSDVGLI
jgi:hypothetical protein